MAAHPAMALLCIIDDGARLCPDYQHGLEEEEEEVEQQRQQDKEMDDVRSCRTFETMVKLTSEVLSQNH